MHFPSLTKLVAILLLIIIHPILADFYNNPWNDPGFLWDKDFCPHYRTDPVECQVRWLTTNDTINAKIAALTEIPILPTYPWVMEKLPEPLLPVGSVTGGVGDGELEGSLKVQLEALYTLAINASEVYDERHPLLKEEDERILGMKKFAYWQRLWCVAYSGQCDSLETRIQMGVKWKQGELESDFKKVREQAGLVELGKRLIDFIGKPENADVVKQCVKTVHHEAAKCNKKGVKCEVPPWDQENVVQCQVDCGKLGCLRVAGGEYLG